MYAFGALISFLMFNLFQLAERPRHGRHLDIELLRYLLGMGVPFDGDEFGDRFEIIFKTFSKLTRH